LSPRYSYGNKKFKFSIVIIDCKDEEQAKETFEDSIHDFDVSEFKIEEVGN